jgi:hypothetical protein
MAEEDDGQLLSEQQSYFFEYLRFRRSFLARNALTSIVLILALGNLFLLGRP